MYLGGNHHSHSGGRGGACKGSYSGYCDRAAYSSRDGRQVNGNDAKGIAIIGAIVMLTILAAYTCAVIKLS